MRTLGVELGLDRVRLALARLGDPQKRFAAVQIAGTNGKGSTAAMTEAVLREAGLRTGLYTSPHLARFTERIRIAGAEVDGDRLAALDRLVVATGVPLTYFEVATALAFLAMAEAGVEVAVLETGLGGRLDAVTTCEPWPPRSPPSGSITPSYLGDTLPAIAREKAGIVKPGVPCFVGRLPPEADAEVAARGRGRRRAAAPAGPRTSPGRRSRSALAGAHQQRQRRARGRSWRGRPRAASAGRSTIGRWRARLAGVRWPGRCERVGDDLLFDCAHNADGARALAAAVAALAPGRRVVLLVSIVDDKDPEAMLAALAPVAAAVVATRSDNPRALPPAALAATAGRLVTDAAAVRRRRRRARRGAPPRRARAAWWWCAARCSWSECCARACSASRSIRCRRRIR